MHFSGTLKAPAVVTKGEQALGRAERKNVFRARQTTPRVLWSAWTLNEESVKTPETMLTRRFPKFLFDALEFAVFLYSNLHVHAKCEPEPPEECIQLFS